MENLSLVLKYRIGQYNEIVFPEDKDVIITIYDNLVDYTIRNNQPGQLRQILEFMPIFHR